MTADDLRRLRAVMILEAVADGEALSLLERWAAGPPGARLTIEASAGLKRLERARNAVK
jgi:hypothetical protein